MFWTRLLSGILLVIVALFVIVTGGDVLFAAVLIISLIGLRELYKIEEIENRIPGIAGCIGSVLYYLLIRTGNEEYILMMAIGFLIVLMAVYVLTFPKWKANQIFLAFFGFFYVTVMLSCIYQTRMLAGGAYLVWLIFISSWGSDTCAYCVGMLIGKHRLSPVLSPKKSIEGAVGGVLGAALIGVIYAVFAGSRMVDFDNLMIRFAVICALGSVISQIGDLAASAIKRNYEIKDYGTLIPGHGGILDRFDSVIFTAPVIYYLALLWG